MPSTDLDSLREDVRDIVLGLTSEVTRYSDTRWRWVEDEADVGFALRTFTVEIDGDLRLPDDRGVFTSEVQTYRTSLRIIVGYGGLNNSDFQRMKNNDARQFYRALAAEAPDGLELAIPQGFSELDRSEKGKRVGAHVFEIDYLLSNLA